MLLKIKPLLEGEEYLDLPAKGKQTMLYWIHFFAGDLNSIMDPNYNSAGIGDEPE